MAPTWMSPSGKYILWYEYASKNYFVWDGMTIKNISSGIKVPLYDEEHDTPSDPSPYGVMGWIKDDAAVLVYDRYDVWKLDPAAVVAPKALTNGNARKTKQTYRALVRDVDKKYYEANESILMSVFDNTIKQNAFAYLSPSGNLSAIKTTDKAFLVSSILGKDAVDNNGGILYTKESYSRSPDLHYAVFSPRGQQAMTAPGATVASTELKLSSINPQQSQYNWGTSSLYKWKTFTGKSSEGILYKPEDFDSTKKYPVLFYFYETVTNGLNGYIPPSPTASRLNISFFVSRGYLVFAPDIYYTTGHPAKNAYDYVVSAATDLAKHKWVDAKNMGIQGQSWGGIQVAQLITMTNMFKAAWAG
ncbi:MAG: S9 family peptidase, partial [Pedobacter sp.]